MVFLNDINVQKNKALKDILGFLALRYCFKQFQKIFSPITQRKTSLVAQNSQFLIPAPKNNQ
jgi:hypothetical protein